MNYAELEEARQRFESVRLDLIATELEIAVTFGKLAMDATFAVPFRRNVHNACVAYNVAVRLLAGVPLDAVTEERIGLSINRLEWIFRKLREREGEITQIPSEGSHFGNREFVPATGEFHPNGEDGDAMPGIPAQDGCKPLSPRERQIVSRIAEGKCNKEIGQELGLSTRTVETYRLRLMRKLELHCVSEVVRFAIRNNLAGG